MQAREIEGGRQRRIRNGARGRHKVTRCGGGAATRRPGPGAQAPASTEALSLCPLSLPCISPSRGHRQPVTSGPPCRLPAPGRVTESSVGVAGPVTPRSVRPCRDLCSTLHGAQHSIIPRLQSASRSLCPLMARDAPSQEGSPRGHQIMYHPLARPLRVAVKRALGLRA